MSLTDLREIELIGIGMQLIGSKGVIRCRTGKIAIIAVFALLSLRRLRKRKEQKAYGYNAYADNQQQRTKHTVEVRKTIQTAVR